MKNLYILTFLLLILLSCNSQNNKYEFEDKLYNCVIESYKDINIEKKVRLLEKIYIKYEFLDDSKGKSYVNFINRIFEQGNFLVLISEELKDELKPFDIIPDRLTCLDTTIMFDTIASRNSRLSVITDAFKEIVSAGNISEPIEFIAFKNMTEDDFNHKFYKSTFLLFLTKFIQNPDFFSGTNTGIQRKLPPIENNKQTEINERNIMIVYVNAENVIFIDEQKVEIEDINQKTKIFYLNPKNDKNLPKKKEIDLPIIGKTKISKGIISLQTERNTRYEKYLQVQNELVRAINELRDDFAKEHFNTHYEDLPKTKQEIVNKVFPLSISEAEPRRMTNE